VAFPRERKGFPSKTNMGGWRKKSGDGFLHVHEKGNHWGELEGNSRVEGGDPMGEKGKNQVKIRKRLKTGRIDRIPQKVDKA